MALNQYLTYNSHLKLETAINQSSGVSSAAKIICTNSSGQVDSSFIPSATVAKKSLWLFGN